MGLHGMIKNAKAKGSRNEYRSMRLLELSGYRCTRSSASLGLWDIIGVSNRDVVLCQTKSNRWPLESEMQLLREFKVPPNCRKIIHRWKDRRQLPDIREVLSNGRLIPILPPHAKKIMNVQ